MSSVSSLSLLGGRWALSCMYKVTRELQVVLRVARVLATDPPLVILSIKSARSPRLEAPRSDDPPTRPPRREPPRPHPDPARPRVFARPLAFALASSCRPGGWPTARGASASSMNRATTAARWVSRSAGRTGCAYFTPGALMTNCAAAEAKACARGPVDTARRAAGDAWRCCCGGEAVSRADSGDPIRVVATRGPSGLASAIAGETPRACGD